MEEVKLDMLGPKEEQLKVLAIYLEQSVEGNEVSLPLTSRSTILIQRYLRNWSGLYTKDGLIPKGALLYYKELIKEQE